MNIAITQKFKILEKNGFKKKVHIRNGDTEIYYTKNNFTVEIHYYLSTTMQYCLEVILDNNSKRANIFNCDFFNKAEINLLRSKIDSIEKKDSLQQELNVYVEFIEKHIGDLCDFIL